MQPEERRRLRSEVNRVKRARTGVDSYVMPIRTEAEYYYELADGDPLGALTYAVESYAQAVREAEALAAARVE